MYISDGQAKFMMVCFLLGLGTLLIGVPAGIIYAIWWFVHHVRFT